MKAVHLGNLTVDRVEESLLPGMEALAMFSDCTAEHLERHRKWLEPDYLESGTGRLMISLHSWVIRTGRHTILVDTCGGNDKDRPAFPKFHQKQTPWLERLNSLGIDPASVDFVMCTHLHVDHAGWNTRLENGRWVPTFPNARYLMSRREHDFWHDRAAAPDRGGVNAGTYEDSVLPVVEQGLALMTDEAYQIDDDLLMEPAPGHTPGHCVLKAGSGHHQAVFSGDLCHSPLQIHYPDWNSRFCEQPDVARLTRRRVLEHCCERRALIFPAHFGGAHFGRVEAAGQGFNYRAGDQPG